MALPAGVRASRDGASWRVRVDSLSQLRALAAASVGAAALREVEVVVGTCRAPQAWTGRPGLPEVTSLIVERSGDRATVSLSLAAPVDAAIALAGVARVLRPSASPTTAARLTFSPGLAADPSACDAAATLVPDLHDVLGTARDRHVRRADVLVEPLAATSADVDADIERATTLQVGPERWRRDGQDFEVCVDPLVHNPIGRASIGPDRDVVARSREGGIDVPMGLRARHLGTSLTEDDVAALVGVRSIAGDVPAPLARQLAACGIVVLPSGSFAPTDDLEWQAASVRERRHALRQHGPWAALDAWPSVSIVVSTHRAEHAEHLIAQLARLQYPRLDVIIGAHGIDPAPLRDRANAVPHPVTVVPVDASRNLGQVLQELSTMAEGDLVTKMDDDDHYGPEHVWDLVLARAYSGAQIVGKTLDWIHLAASADTVFRPVYGAEEYADFVCGGTMLISRADLAAVGGWRPVPKSVDRALLDRVLDDGGLVYRTHGLGYVYERRAQGHTASVSDDHFRKKVVRTVDGLVRHQEFGT